MLLCWWGGVPHVQGAKVWGVEGEFGGGHGPRVQCAEVRVVEGKLEGWRA